jgi:hypothetical protein
LFVFVRRVECALDVPVQRSQHTDARMHQRAQSSAAINSASVAACHSGLACSAFGSFMM